MSQTVENQVSKDNLSQILKEWNKIS